MLVTGHDGYIGCVLVPMFRAAGHDVVGIDSGLFHTCTFGASPPTVPTIAKDVRDVLVADLDGFDAVVHLAAVSNDPVGELNPDCTYEVNCHASVRLARLAKQAGVSRFLFSSSCSLYGAGGDGILDEHAPFNPVTAYGQSKVLAEQGISKLADDSFSPTYLRNATAYGVSSRFRGDLVVNNLTGLAFTTREVRLRSDGTPWRPVVHVEDIARAFLAVLQAPREVIHDEAFNVGRNEENYRIREIADIVEDLLPDARVTFAEDAGPDKRSYQVSFDKISSTFPHFRPTWTVPRGVAELLEAFRREGITLEDLTGSRFQRIARIKELLREGRIDATLRWRDPTKIEEMGLREAADPGG